MKKKTSRVVGAIIKDGDKYLCMQRPRSRYLYISEHWEFPGGKVEKGESDHEEKIQKKQLYVKLKKRWIGTSM